MYWRVPTSSRPQRLACCSSRPIWVRPVSGLPVLSAVKPRRQGLSSFTRTVASTVSGAWPLCRSSVVCLAGLVLATFRLAEMSRMLGVAPSTRPGQAGADVGGGELPVALHLHAADLLLDHAQAHDPLVQLLLRQLDRDDGIAVLLVSLLQRLDRPPDVTEAAARAGERRQRGLDLGRRQQAVSLHGELRDGKTRSATAFLVGRLCGQSASRQSGKYPERAGTA